MVFWIYSIALFFLIGLASLFVFVLRKQIFSKKTGMVLAYVTTGLIVAAVGHKLLTIPVITKSKLLQ